MAFPALKDTNSTESRCFCKGFQPNGTRNADTRDGTLLTDLLAYLLQLCKKMACDEWNM
jgi:hypothetical protein